MNNKENRPEVPLGLGYALAQNSDALKVFAQMSSQRQKQIIEESRLVTSKNEMRQFVRNLHTTENQ